MDRDLIAQVVERQVRGLEVRGSNPGPSSNFSLEFKFKAACTVEI